MREPLAHPNAIEKTVTTTTKTIRSTSQVCIFERPILLLWPISLSAYAIIGESQADYRRADCFPGSEVWCLVCWAGLKMKAVAPLGDRWANPAWSSVLLFWPASAENRRGNRYRLNDRSANLVTSPARPA